MNKENLVAKICCVIFALALWLMVVGQNPDIQYEMTYYAVPVTVSNANGMSESSGLSIISGYDYNINITVRGNRAKLSNYTSEDISATVDVGNITESGDHELPVVISLPPSSGFSVVSQSLENVSVVVDKLTSVEFDVNVNIVNAQYNTDSYALGTPTVNPGKITVKGPEKVLQSISGAYVNLDLGSVSSNIGFNNRVVLLDSNGEEVDSPYISLSKQYVEGTVPFISIEEAQKIVEKSVPLVYSFKYGYYNDSNCNVTISPQFVTLSGYEKDLNKIQSINVFEIDETKITDDTAFTVTINTPDGTTISQSKKTATVVLKFTEEFSHTQIELDELIYINKSDKLSVKLDTSHKITLMGTKDLITQVKQAIDSDEKVLEAFVDMSVISAPGRYKLPVNATITNSSFKKLWCLYSEVYIVVDQVS